MNPFQVVIFLVFHLPLMLIEKGLEMISKFLESVGISKKKLLWSIPYFLLVILSILIIILWSKGYR